MATSGHMFFQSIRLFDRGLHDADDHAAEPNEERHQKGDHRYDQRKPLFDAVGPCPPMAPVIVAVRLVHELGLDPHDVSVESLHCHHLGHGRVDVPAPHRLFRLVAGAPAPIGSVAGRRHDIPEEAADVQEVRPSPPVRPSRGAVRSGASVVAFDGNLLDARDWPSAVVVLSPLAAWRV
ncbi:hypothetical protein MTO96_015660 [Rhipicephalus appendiculatus]